MKINTKITITKIIDQWITELSFSFLISLSEESSTPSSSPPERMITFSDLTISFFLYLAVFPQFLFSDIEIDKYLLLVLRLDWRTDTATASTTASVNAPPTARVTSVQPGDREERLYRCVDKLKMPNCFYFSQFICTKWKFFLDQTNWLNDLRNNRIQYSILD